MRFRLFGPQVCGDKSGCRCFGLRFGQVRAGAHGALAEVLDPTRYLETFATRSGSRAQPSGGHARNRTGVQGFAVLCVTTPPRGHPGAALDQGAAPALV